MNKTSETRTDMILRNAAGMILDYPDTYCIEDPERCQEFGITVDDLFYRHDRHPDRPERWSCLNADRTMFIQTAESLVPSQKRVFRIHDLVLPVVDSAANRMTQQMPQEEVPSAFSVWAGRVIRTAEFAGGAFIPIIEFLPDATLQATIQAARIWHALKRALGFR